MRTFSLMTDRSRLAGYAVIILLHFVAHLKNAKAALMYAIHFALFSGREA